MGFSTLIDIIGSILIGGFLLLILLRLNGSATENSYNFNEELILQQNLTSVAQIVEYDFRKIGYCYNPDSLAVAYKTITKADSNSIKFKTDVDGNGFIDDMEYKLGSYDISTPNPEDRYLYRIVNDNDTTKLNLGVTSFKLLYMDSANDTLTFPISEPGEIASMEVNLSVEKTFSYGEKFKENDFDKYSGAFWRQIKLVARNLKNR